MARNRRPSYLKRQKEQKRVERAAEKREARRLRRTDRAMEVEDNSSPVAEGLPSVENANEPGPAEDR